MWHCVSCVRGNRGFSTTRAEDLDKSVVKRNARWQWCDESSKADTQNSGARGACNAQSSVFPILLRWKALGCLFLTSREFPQIPSTDLFKFKQALLINYKNNFSWLGPLLQHQHTDNTLTHTTRYHGLKLRQNVFMSDSALSSHLKTLKTFIWRLWERLCYSQFPALI